MRQNHNSVSREVEIRFYSVGAGGHGASKRCHGVFGILGFVASMRDALGRGDWVVDLGHLPLARPVRI